MTNVGRLPIVWAMNRGWVVVLLGTGYSKDDDHGSPRSTCVDLGLRGSGTNCVWIWDCVDPGSTQWIWVTCVDPGSTHIPVPRTTTSFHMSEISE